MEADPTPDLQALLQSLVHQEDEHAIILLDPSGCITAWLGAAEKIFGYKSPEVLKQPSAILFTQEDRHKKIPEYELNVAAANGHAEDDRWMLRHDGRRFWATGILKPIRNENGDILAFGKILRNRTDLKGQLEAGQKQIDRLNAMNESKNVFIATLAHELRNPLAAIRNSLAIMELTGLPDDQCRFAATTAQRQLDHMQRMIEDLLEVAKADVGKILLQKRNISLNDIVKAAFEASRQASSKSTHHLELIMTDHPIVVYGDASRLHQIFVNLIDNALKYTAFGGSIWVKVSTEEDQAVVKVEDTGIGISADMMPRIFDLFTQAEMQTRGTGLGIGLSLVKDLTALHGGTVQVRSDGLGKGSEFTIRLPLAKLE